MTQSFSYLNSVIEYLRAYVEVPAGDDCFTPADFFAGGSPQLVAMEQALCKRYQTDRPGVLASVLLDGYQWGLISTGVACYLCENRVPALHPGDVLLHLNTEHWYVDAVTYHSGAFVALPDDPAAGHPDATILPTRDALREHLRRSLEDHLGMATTQLARRFGVNERRLWPPAADRIADTIIWLGKELYEPAQRAGLIEREIEAVIRVPNSPLKNKITGVLTVTTNGCSEPFLRRAACCHVHWCADQGYCNTCPKLSLEERIARLRDYLAEKHEDGAA